MPLSMSQASLPVFTRMLGNLKDLLDKAAAFAEAKKLEPGVLVNARLAPDMFPLARQVQIATDAAKGCAARLAGVEVPSFPDTEATLAELVTRIVKTVDFVKSIKPEQIDGSESKPVSLKAGPRELNFTGQDYLLHFALPNLYFHIATAYDILRHNGVALGKMDYLGQP